MITITKKRILPLLSLGLFSGAILTGCSLAAPNLSQEESEQCTADFTLCLGDLADYLDESDYQSLYEDFTSVWAARQKRESQGKTEMGFWEKSLMSSFSQKLDKATEEVFGEVDYYYPDNDEISLADFSVDEMGNLGVPSYSDDWEDYSYDTATVTALWEQAGALLPEGSLTVFDTYSVFTDGSDGVVGYVYWNETDSGLTWGLALDPADADDTAFFQETILHEYFHYLSLNDSQAEYGTAGDGSTYAEPDFDMVTRSDSYLNQFYTAFWSDILKDERLTNPDSLQFFPRHYTEFYDDYSSTSPSEDIAECFACYVLFEDGWETDYEDDLWVRKINWFDQFEELRAFRSQVREGTKGGTGGALSIGAATAIA